MRDIESQFWETVTAARFSHTLRYKITLGRWKVWITGNKVTKLKAAIVHYIVAITFSLYLFKQKQDSVYVLVEHSFPKPLVEQSNCFSLTTLNLHYTLQYLMSFVQASRVFSTLVNHFCTDFTLCTGALSCWDRVGLSANCRPHGILLKVTVWRRIKLCLHWTSRPSQTC